MKLTMIDEMRVLPLLRPHVPREDVDLPYLLVWVVTRRDCEVVDFTRSRVKNYSELTNLMKMYRIKGYNGK